MGNNSMDWAAADNAQDLLELIHGRFELVAKQHENRLYDYGSYTNLYDDSNAGSLLNLGIHNTFMEQSYTYNVVRSCVSTLASKIGKAIILPRVTVSGATFAGNEKARKVDRVLRGLYRKYRVNDVMKKTLLHCLLFGNGFTKVMNDGDGGLIVEPVAPDELFVDMADGYYDNPLNMYHMKLIGRDKLKAMFPDKAKYIDAASAHKPTNHDGDDCLDIIPVIEAFRRSTSDEEGRRSLVIDTVVLEDEAWDREYFPFVKMNYVPPIAGFYTKGLGHELSGIQQELSNTLEKIAEAHRLSAGMGVVVGEGAGVDESAITNEVGFILRVKDPNQIKFSAIPAMSNEVYAHAQNLYNKAYEIAGVSQLSAGSKRPPSLRSGEALKEYADRETERFALLAQEYLITHSRVAELILKELDAEGSDMEIAVFDSELSLDKISFSDLALDIDNIMVKIFSVSDLPSRPEAKKDTIVEYLSAGFMTLDEARELLDMPDLGRYDLLNNASRKAVDKFIGKILSDPDFDFDQIDDNMDLGLMREKAIQAYNYAYVHLEDEDNYEDIQDKLVRLITSITELETSLQQQAQPAAAPQAPQVAPQEAQPNVSPVDMV